MKYRTLGKTDFKISEISLGTWQVGGRWGEPFDDKNADKILNAAIDQGINFIDTADVYGDGGSESELAVGRLLNARSERIFVATKCGRQINPHINEGYTPEALRKFVEDSLRRMKIDRIDLIQLHCPPTQVYYRPEIFELFDRLIEEGKIYSLGVSVEKVEEAIKAIEYDNVASVQIIFNMFRQRPNELFFKLARKKNVGILARVPLASGLLTGKFSKITTFGKNDHRNFNRDGAFFDKGETFSGVDYDTGLEAVNELRQLFPNYPIHLLALKWILMFEDVTCVIPGASHLDQLVNNLDTANMNDLSPEELSLVRDVYEKHIKKSVHQTW